MKRQVIFIATMALMFTAAAQRLEDYCNRPFAHLGLTVGGGMGSLMYDNSRATSSPGMSIDVGFHYTHFFSGFGIGVGAHIGSVGSSALYNGDEVTSGQVHANNPHAQYELTTHFDSWKERQKVTVVELPLEVFYRFRAGGGRHLICGLGAQLDIPMRGKYSSGGGSYTTTGVFASGGPHSVSEMPEHGFSTYEETFDAEITDFAIGLSVVGNVGLRLPLGYSGGVYVGLWASYGLPSILESTEAGEGPLLNINRDEPSVIDYHGTFAATGNPAVHMLRVGLKVGIDFGSPMDN